MAILRSPAHHSQRHPDFHALLSPRLPTTNDHSSLTLITLPSIKLGSVGLRRHSCRPSRPAGCVLRNCVFHIHPRLRVAALRGLQISKHRLVQAQASDREIHRVPSGRVARSLTAASRRCSSFARSLFADSKPERFHAQFQIGIFAAKQFRLGIRFRQAGRQCLERLLRNRQLPPQLFVLRQQRRRGHSAFRVFNFGF